MRPFNSAKRCATRRWWLPVAIALGLICFSLRSGYGQDLQGVREKLPAQKGCESDTPTLDVSAVRMTFESRTRTFLFEDKVRIVRCAMVITCDRLQVVHGANEQTLERIIATGNVHFTQDTRAGTAERADYFEAEQKLVLTGKPRLWDTQERNELTGDEIVVLLQSEKVLVKQARVLFHPRKTAGKVP